MGRHVAIDFGTTNTVVSEWVESESIPKTLRLDGISSAANSEMPTVIPSVIYVKDETRPLLLLGNQVLSAGLNITGNDRFFRGFKRMINSSLLQFPRKIGMREYSYRQIGEHFLLTIIKALNLGNNDELVFSVPVNSFEFYRKWIGDLCGILLPRTKVSFIDESTAAAVGYGPLQAGKRIMVIDFGGGTLDISFVRTSVDVRKTGTGDTQAAVVLAKAGIDLGGEDIDAWILEDILRENKLSLDSVRNIWASLKNEVEKLKIDLSFHENASFDYFDADQFRSISSKYSRARLEELLGDKEFYAQIQRAVDEVLDQAQMKGLGKNDVETVLLVGGTCLMPSVQRSIKQIFGKEKVRCNKPFEAVSHGAVLYSKKLNVIDHIYNSYAIRHMNHQYSSHEYKVLFESGMNYPTQHTVDLELGCSRPNQTAIELVFAEIQKILSRSHEVIIDGNRIVPIEEIEQKGKVVLLNDADEKKVLAYLNPPGNPGPARLSVKLGINKTKQLVVTVKDLLTKQTLYSEIPILDLR